MPTSREPTSVSWPKRSQSESVTLPKVTLAKRLQRALGQDWGVAWVFMVPTVILMGGIIAYPFLRAVYISFTNTTTLHDWALGSG